MSFPRAILKPRRAQPFFARQPWVYAGAIASIEGEPADGQEIDLYSSASHFIARGLFNSRSKIRIRLYGWEADQPLDDAFFRARLERAIAFRRGPLGLNGADAAVRLVFSEGDGLSGLIVDQYGRWLTAQFTSLALASRREQFGRSLMELTGAAGIVLRTERSIGKLEGLDLQDGLLCGEPAPDSIEINDGGVRFLVNIGEGQKTGFYIDQRDNRRAAAALARGRSVLDAFCYSGGCGLHAAHAGAQSILGVDASAPAVDLARRNAELNGVANATYVHADVFHHMTALTEQGARFGMVVLDPPKFARARHAIPKALSGYRRLLSLAMKLLESDGILVMCCCSGLITADMLVELMGQVAATTRREVQLLEVRGQSPDHPVSIACLESSYLKCLIARVL